MKTYENLPTTYRRQTSHTCDICGEEIVEKNRDILDVTVEARYGEHGYYGDGHGKSFEVDLCLPCFRDKLVPAMHALGLNKDVVWKDWEF